ncbi:Uncharacterized protein APZ42_030920 [Daphnia magna]|uniref:Uncharacterized protein n=1 Tax=Daphnia magna TaxID=35525 RepID=A0A164NF95_9CRUS|nr:Uncharacterized protein APZ42_030920 [Daphnia magna]
MQFFSGRKRVADLSRQPAKMGTVKVLGERTKKKHLSFEYYLI